MAKKKKTTKKAKKELTQAQKGALVKEKRRKEEKRASTCHIEVRGSQKVAFVHAEHGRWIKTHVAAAFVPCPVAECAAAKGFACYNLGRGGGYQVPTHNARVTDYYIQLAAEMDADPRSPVKTTKRKGKKGASVSATS